MVGILIHSESFGFLLCWISKPLKTCLKKKGETFGFLFRPKYHVYPNMVYSEVYMYIYPLWQIFVLDLVSRRGILHDGQDLGRHKMVVDVKDNKNPNLIHTNNNMTSVAQLPICACRDKCQFPELPRATGHHCPFKFFVKWQVCLWWLVSFGCEISTILR